MTDDRCALLCLDLEAAESLRENRLGDESAGTGAARAAAFSDPTRLVLADALDRGGELCVCDLSWVVERSESLVSHHMRKLRAEGHVSSRRDGKMVMYSLTENGRRFLHAVLGDRDTAEMVR